MGTTSPASTRIGKEQSDPEPSNPLSCHHPGSGRVRGTPDLGPDWPLAVTQEDFLVCTHLQINFRCLKYAEMS